MKKNFYSLLFVAISIGAFGQKVNIQWEGSKSFDFSSYKQNLPYFKNEGYDVGSRGVSIVVEKKNEGKQVIAKNFAWEKAKSEDLYDINPEFLPNEDSFEVVYAYSEKLNSEVGSVYVPTFKKVNNVIYRLLSVDVELSNKNYVVNKGIGLGTTENPLESGTFYKIKVEKSGVFKITKKFLQDNGINVSGINPNNFRIYGNGGLMLPENNSDARYAALQENAIQVVGGDDGVWNDDDYALFYAQGPNGFNLTGTTTRNGRIDTRRNKSSNYINIYEDYAYYFINFDKGPGKRINPEDTAVPSSLLSRYDDYQYINEEKYNLMKLGRLWVGDAFTTPKEVKFDVRTPILSTDIVKYNTRVAAKDGKNNQIEISVNGKNSTTIAVGVENVSLLVSENILSNTPTSSITFNYKPNTGPNPYGQFYWDYAEITYKQDLSFNNIGQLAFRSYDINEKTDNLYGFSISNTTGLEQVWDVSDVTNVKRKVNKNTSASSFNFGYQTSSTNKFFNNEFVAFNQSAAYNPTFVGRIDNQNLSALSNVNYLIITQANMIGEAQRLANYHRSKSNMNVEIVDINKIYNEYSSGSKDITAVRDFVTKLNASGSLKYVFLLGDTSYDFKDRVPNNTDVIPSYQSEESHNYSDTYVTDDYFVMTKPQGDIVDISKLIPNIPIGRLPAANVAEAKLLIDKTLAYYNALPGQSSPFGEWRMKLDFVVDDNDNETSTPFHNTMNASLVSNFETGTARSEYNVRKLYLDAFPPETTAGGQRYPQVNQAISNDVGNSLYLFYFGHGGINGWAQERVLTTSEISNFNNFTSLYSRFPLVSTITCEFTLWDDPGTYSAGEQVIKLKTGGAATMITSSRAIATSYGEDFTGILTNNIFNLELENDRFRTLGNSFLEARKKRGADINHLKVNYLGDPAMTLSRPQRLLNIDEVVTPEAGKIRALDFVKITGHVNKADGTPDDTFTGRAVINIFDKKLDKVTRNNDPYKDMKPPLQYKEEGSPIVKASGKVENGKFTVEFYVPKDINYNLGTGRLLAYADNKSYDVFYNGPVTVGGINPNGVNDTEPPKVNLYMNNVNFANGGITDQNPMLLACVTDNIGINSTGSGIGHDITVLLDGEVINTKVLNDFYSPGEGNGCVNASLSDYQKGNVTYPFRNLKPGEHQLTFKIWDINNNSTTSTLNFVVKDESQQQLVINRPLNWPNPFTNKTYVQFEHNCDDILDVNVQIFTITGKLVRTLTNSITAEPFLEGYRTPKQAIEWDGKDDFGDTVAKGTYIFKIFARSQNQDKCKGSATAVEKMVLLK
ncbi:Peptidase family C25 [Soonwooa buanensis]|uniref:Peptidase family C25 n=1 Tax=Soonwooa buanensis TaxID=619805 RepID=A0A1T5D2V8_9FLAO|nr:type IX secretion system sortase PorU [Soonwooa buanensis]SKB66078.1 Peptidase family C25 [Soonwooa buanensis]